MLYTLDFRMFVWGNCFYMGLTSRFPLSGSFYFVVFRNKILCYVMVWYTLNLVFLESDNFLDAISLF